MQYKILANTLFLGKELLYLTECHSTNDVALERIRAQEAREGLLVVTDYQSKGRGQRGNTWEGQPGLNLTFSLVVEPHFLPPHEQFKLNMAVSFAVMTVLNAFDPEIRIKWPNDIIHPESGKLGGILIENILFGQKLSYSIIGIGLNLNQRKFENKTATSLALLTGQGTDSALLLEQLVKRIEQHYLKLKKQVFADIQEHYKLALYGMETWRRYEAEEVFEARMVDVLPSGHLVLEKRSGERNQYAFKEVKFLDLYS